MTIFNSIWRRQSEIESNIVPIDATEVVQAKEVVVAKAPETRRFIARQTIFDRNRQVFGYELLFRSGWENCFRGDTDDATRKMIADGALYGFEELTHGAPSFVNCTRESLVNGLVTLLPNTTVLEILETVTGDEEVLKACAQYKELGYKLALDDFRLKDGMDGLVALADYIKVDFRLSGEAERREIIEEMRGRDVILIAEKVETDLEFQAAVTEGFTLFQGYFFCYPAVFSKKRVPTNGANYLYLLSALSQGHFDVVQLSLMLKSEVSLSYQLLRLVNSTGFGARQEVRSLQDALVLVGEMQFRKLIMNAIATETCRARSSELLVHVLHRARFMELMARFTAQDAMEQYLLGLLSLMDVMLEMPVTDVIEAIPLRKEMKQALAGDTNSVSLALRLFERYREADWALCIEHGAILRVTESDISEVYRESLLWAEKAVASEPKKDRLAS